MGVSRNILTYDIRNWYETWMKYFPIKNKKKSKVIEIAIDR